MHNPLLSTPSAVPAANSNAPRGFAGIGQQILNFLAGGAERAAASRALAGLTRRELDDCGMTLADIKPGLPDLYASDFRVQHIGQAHAA